MGMILKIWMNSLSYDITYLYQNQLKLKAISHKTTISFKCVHTDAVILMKMYSKVYDRAVKTMENYLIE